MRYISAILVLFGACWVFACQYFPQQSEGKSAASDARVQSKSEEASSRTVRVDLAPYRGEHDPVDMTLEFSEDGSMVCVYRQYWRYLSGWLTTPRCLVYDLQGRPVGGVASRDGVFSARYEHLFRGAIPQANLFSETLPYADRTLRFDKPIVFPEEIAKSLCYRFSDDGTRCVILSAHQNAKRKSSRVELWQIRPAVRRLWVAQLDREQPFWRHASFFQQKGRDRVLLVTDSFATILDGSSGRTVDYVRLSPDESVRDIEEFRRELSMRNPGASSLPSEYLTFDVGSGASGHGLLACTGIFGRWIRVFSLDPPYALVYEANRFVHPCVPRRGMWQVSALRFDGDHYLVVESGWGGRFPKHMNLSEVLDTDTWRVVWRDDRPDIRGVTLSPDGTKLAFKDLRDPKHPYLTIGPFLPKGITSAH